MGEPSAAAAVDVVGRVRTIVTVRWLGAVFAAGQVVAYGQPYPPGLWEAALGVVGVLLVSNVVFEVLLRRGDPARHVGPMAAALVVTDVLVLSAITWVYAFDSLSAIFVVLVLLPIEAAVLYALRGALWTWAAVAVLYVGREWFGTRYGNPFEVESVTFRVGIIGIVALIVGTLVRDLLRQRHATAVALVEAERSEASLTAVIRVLAHDLRAPIAAARTSMDTLRSLGDRLTDEERDRVLDVGRRQADRALLLARDLLDLARAEAGTLTVEPAPVALADVLSGVELALGGSGTLQVDVGDHAVVADPVRLEQVLFNLLDNAAKHGAPPFEVVARRVGDVVELTVRDHGPGVPDGVALFTPFARAGEGSVGLGMWIVRHLMEAMGGEVRHEPADPGARFVLRLPAAAPTGARAED